MGHYLWRNGGGVSIRKNPETVPDFSGLCACKANVLMTIAIASDRLIALVNPFRYKYSSSAVFASLAFLAAISWTGFDISILFWTANFNKSNNCAAGGCFMSKEFRYIYKSIALIPDSEHTGIWTYRTENFRVPQKQLTVCFVQSGIRIYRIFYIPDTQNLSPNPSPELQLTITN